MSDDEPVYNDETKFITWEVVKELALFMQVLDPELKSIDQEQESWDRAIAKYGKDELFIPIPETDNSIYPIDVTKDLEPISGHEWVSSETWCDNQNKELSQPIIVCVDQETGERIKNIAECKVKPGEGCTQYNTHRKTIIGWEKIPNIRNEFLPSDGLQDRPTENFWFSLAGVRSIGENDLWLLHNQVCTHCRILTPNNQSICQNCDRELAIAS